jgi:Amidohydrolase family
LPANPTPSQLDQVANEAFGGVIERSKQGTAYVVERHGHILFATDTPSAPTYANPPGLNGWLEMHRLLQAGETPAQIFKSATLINARALKLDRDIGSVQVGKRANLLLLRLDPTRTIDAYADIVAPVPDSPSAFAHTKLSIKVTDWSAILPARPIPKHLSRAKALGSFSVPIIERLSILTFGLTSDRIYRPKSLIYITLRRELECYLVSTPSTGVSVISAHSNPKRSRPAKAWRQWFISPLA